MSRVISFVFTILVIVGFRYYPEIQMYYYKMTGSEWNESRPVIMEKARTGFMNSIPGLKGELYDKYAACYADARIAWLNETDCNYRYNTKTQSVDEHLEAQTACLTKSGGDKQSEVIDAKCTLDHIPNDFSIFKGLYANIYADSLKDEIKDKEQLNKVAACISDKAVKFFVATGCKPFNMESKTVDITSKCSEEVSEKLEGQIEKFADDCAS